MKPIKPGRPAGSIETPQSLLRRAMQDSAKLAQRARKLLERRLIFLESAETTAQVTEEIISILEALDNSVDRAGKLLVQKGTKDETSADPVNAEKIMQEMTKGKQPR